MGLHGLLQGYLYLLYLLVKIFGKDSNKSKFDSGGIKVETEFVQCLLPLSPADKVGGVRLGGWCEMAISQL
jgi:hypothetical protein